jgi:hypothetical protein
VEGAKCGGKDVKRALLGIGAGVFIFGSGGFRRAACFRSWFARSGPRSGAVDHGRGGGGGGVGGGARFKMCLTNSDVARWR